MIFEPRLFDRILNSLWVAIRRELLRKVLPDIAHVVAPAALDVVYHLPNGTLQDLRLPPWGLADALIVAEGAITGASRDFQTVEDLVVGEAVAEAVFDQADDLMVGGDPGAAVFFLLRVFVSSEWNRRRRARTFVANATGEGMVELRRATLC